MPFIHVDCFSCSGDIWRYWLRRYLLSIQHMELGGTLLFAVS